MIHPKRELKGTDGERNKHGGSARRLTIVTLFAAAALAVLPGIASAAEAAQDVDAGIAGHVLRVKGTKDDDKLTLRLKAGDANIIEVDVADDGTADFSFDRALLTEIEVRAGQGNDLIRINEANGPIVEPTSIFGEQGDDTILGGSAIERIDGGAGDDFVDGNRGNDIAFMGTGNDTFRWDPGDGSDVVEGEGGRDTLLFNGANAGENIDLSASGKRFIFFRQQAGITMDMDGVEVSVFNALGGSDTITVNDLTGTDVTQVDLNLAAVLDGGAGDGSPDLVTVNATGASDAIVVTGSAGNVNVAGLSAAVAISHAEAAGDRLVLNTLGGNDTVDTSGLAPAVVQLVVDGVPV